MSVKETVFEILGVEEKPQSQQQLVTVGKIGKGFPVEAVGRVASRYGISSGQLAKMLGSSERTISRRKKEKNLLMPPLQIGYTALVQGWGVGTNNQKHFQRIPELMVLHWLK
jgi:predicted nucleic acid-binding protein